MGCGLSSWVMAPPGAGLATTWPLSIMYMNLFNCATFFHRPRA